LLPVKGKDKSFHSLKKPDGKTILSRKCFIRQSLEQSIYADKWFI